MTLQIAPQIATRPLSDVQLGSLVYLDGKFCFVCVGQVRMAQKVCLAVFHETAPAFVYRVEDVTTDVLTFGTELVLEPDVRAIAENQRPGYNSGTDLFLGVEDPHVVVRIDSSHDWRLLNIRTGVFLGSTGNVMSAIKKWKLGVRDSSGAVISLINAK